MDIAWLLGCTALVLLMQAGFSCLESGLVRAKNGTDVAMKNLADFSISAVFFYLFGYGLMLGPSFGGWLGDPSFTPPPDAASLTSILFQLAFAGTATTIVSGAAAERMKFSAYLAIAAVVSGLIYPVIGHWAWAGRHGGQGWLAALGFVDFAGSTVVHVVGGTVSLAAVWAVGPRIGRFTPGANLEPSSLPMSVLGAFLLWVGWLGFNAGAALYPAEVAPRVALATVLAGAAGALAGMAWALTRMGRPDVPTLINGLLGGLVGVTAGCHLYDGEAALVVGAIGGVVASAASELLDRAGLDDAVGAAPVHLAGGAWGTLAVAIFGDPALGAVPTLLVQALGVIVTVSFAGAVAALALRVIAATVGLRVSATDEVIGLNVSEHGAGSQLLDMLVAMDAHARGEGWTPLHADLHTDFGRVAWGYNRTMRTIGERESQLRESVAMAELALEQARVSADARAQFLFRMSHELRTPLNAIIGYSDLIADSAENEDDRRSARTIRQAGDHLLGMVSSLLDVVKVGSEQITLRRQPCDVDGLIEEMVAARRPLAVTRGLRLDHTPAGHPPLMIDAERLRQALNPLLDNAVRFTEIGYVRVQSRVEAGALAIDVIDTGVGVPPEKLQTIFELFEQADGSATRARDGAGVGLPLARRLARLMGGDVTVSSLPGDGATFTLRIAADVVLGHESAPASAERT